MAETTKRQPARPRSEWPWYVDAPGDTDSAVAQRLATACANAIDANRDRAHQAQINAEVIDGKGLISPFIKGLNIDHARITSQLLRPVIRNTARSLVETLVSKEMSLQTLLPKLMATGGDYSQHLSAGISTYWAQAYYAQRHGRFSNMADLHRHGGLLLAGVTGSAALFPEVLPTGRIDCHLDDTLTIGQERSDMQSAPFALVRSRAFHPDDAAYRWPDHQNEIFAAAEGYGPARRSGKLEDRGAHVIVCQGWLFRRGEEMGRRIFCLRDGRTILDRRDYDSEAPPCAMAHFQRALSSEWGLSITHIIWEMLRAENLALDDWSIGIRNASQLLIQYEAGTVLNEGALTTSRGHKVIKRQRNTKEVAITVPPMDNPALVNFAETMRQGSHDTSGVSYSSSTAQRSEGVTSGIFQSYVAKLQTERQAEFGLRMRDWRVAETTRVLLYAAKEALEVNEEASVEYRAESEEQEIALADLDLEGADRLIIQAAAIDEEAMSPAARLKRAEQMYQAGEINAAVLFDYEKHLDTKALTEDIDVARRWTNAMIQLWQTAPEEDVETKEPDLYEVPSPFLGPDVLAAILQQVAIAHTEARIRKMPINRIMLYETFMNRVALMLDAERGAARNASGNTEIAPLEIDPTTGLPPGAGGGELPLPGGGAPPGGAGLPPGGAPPQLPN